MSDEDKALTQYIDLGMPDTNTSAQYIGAVDDVMAAIPHGRVVLCIPVAGDYSQFYPEGAAYQGRIEAAEYIRTTYPNNAFEIHQILLDANDGSAGDLVDVANEVIPRSLRIAGDNIHQNNAGHVVRAAAVDAFLDTKQWGV